MGRSARQRELTVFTIGHSNHPLETFIGLLKEHRIEVLVDTRSFPRSRFAPHFDKENLGAKIKDSRIQYLFLGRELGGRPEGDEFYDADGRVDYARVARSSRFLEGISRLEEGIKAYRVALMCSEEDPEGCHRRLLVGRVLSEKGVLVRHIRGDGSVRREEGQKSTNEQPALFGKQEAEWKSIRPVSRKRRLRSSSAS